MYDQRPARCAEYTCLWLRSPDGLPDDSLRPDRLGLILDVQQLDSGRLVFRAMEARPGAATTGRGWDVLLALQWPGGPSVSVVRYGDATASLVLTGDGRVVDRAPPGHRWPAPWSS